MPISIKGYHESCNPRIWTAANALSATNALTACLPDCRLPSSSQTCCTVLYWSSICVSLYPSHHFASHRHLSLSTISHYLPAMNLCRLDCTYHIPRISRISRTIQQYQSGFSRSRCCLLSCSLAHLSLSLSLSLSLVLARSLCLHDGTTTPPVRCSVVGIIDISTTGAAISPQTTPTYREAMAPGQCAVECRTHVVPDADLRFSSESALDTLGTLRSSFHADQSINRSTNVLHDERTSDSLADR